MNQLKSRNVLPKVALVIGAGGVKCAAALGVYKTLQQIGVNVDLFGGCSGGSIYAALLASGASAAEAQHTVTQFWTRELTQFKNRFGYLMTLWPFKQPFKQNFALRHDHLIVERLNAVFGAQTIEGMPLHLQINATDFDTGEGVIFNSGRVIDAIRASIAIPSVFRPWEIDGRLYSDGILSDPLPIEAAAQAGADIIIAVGFATPIHAQVRNATHFTRHVNTILTNNLLRSKITLCETAYNAAVLVLEPQFEERVRLFDTHKIPDIITQGEQLMHQHLGWLDQALYQHMPFNHPPISETALPLFDLAAVC